MMNGNFGLDSFAYQPIWHPPVVTAAGRRMQAVSCVRTTTRHLLTHLPYLPFLPLFRIEFLRSNMEDPIFADSIPFSP